MTVTGSRSVPRRRYIGLGLLAAGLVAFLLFLVAPNSNRLNSGSTWGNAPDGYSGWYAYMQEQGVDIQRWQRPIDELLTQANSTDTPGTLLIIAPAGSAFDSKLYPMQTQLSDWREQGNHLIMLRQKGRVSTATFTSQIDSPAGEITIQTRRRFMRTKKEQDEVEEGLLIVDSAADDGQLLADKSGTIVLQRRNSGLSEQGIITISTTPYIAANAHADAPGNFAFLADVVQTIPGPIWIDEYLHGYKDNDVVIKEVAGNWLNYLAKTPLLLLAVQGTVILFIALLAQNSRPGLRKTIPTLQVDNSEAYIKALAGVLHKANNRDFLIETLTRAERKTLQRALGLGDTPVSSDTLQVAWQQTTGRSVAELTALQAQPRSDTALQAWLKRLQSLRSVVDSQNSEAPSDKTD